VDQKHPKNAEILQAIRRYSPGKKTNLSIKEGVGYLRFGR
jgi:hypothetical protein